MKTTPLVRENDPAPRTRQTCCGLPLDGVPSLVVKLNGSPKASASIDAPLNGKAFAKAVIGDGGEPGRQIERRAGRTLLRAGPPE